MNNRTGTTLAAGIAAIALMAAPAALAQGKGNGGEKSQGNGGAKGAQSKGSGNKGSGGNANRGGGKKAATTTRGNANGNAGNSRSSTQRGGNGQGNNGNSNRRQNAQSDNGKNRNNGNRAAVRQNGNRGNGNGNQAVRVLSRDGIDLDVGFALPQLRQTLVRDRRVINGCPPGLAKKRNGCLPPGQAKQNYRSYDPGFFGLRGIGSGQYFYDDGYLLSYRGDSLAGYLPLLGGALGIGNVWPSYYEAAPLPAYYNSYYGLNDQRGYRFADNVIYRVDPDTAAIASVAALLTGDDISVGRPLPVGYDVYNVPYGYRNQYADGPGARYRYVDGYIYEVDPETALVVAAIDLVT